MRRIPAFSEATEECLRSVCKENAELPAEDRLFISVFAPVISAFVFHVLTDAKKRDFKRLVFCARDAYLFYKTAQILGPVFAPEISLSYIHVSRYSLRAAEYALSPDDCLDTICLGALDLSFEKMMKRASLSDEEIKHFAKVCGLDGKISEKLDNRQIFELKKRLLNSKEFFEAVHAHAKDKLEPALDYLKQECMDKDSLRNTKTAIVDSGWIGTVQKSLNKLIGVGEKLEGYYFGLYSVPKGVSEERYDSFYFSPGAGVMNLGRKNRFSVCLFETVCSSPESMTYGYERKGERIVPILKPEGNPNKDYILRVTDYMKDYSVRLAGSLKDDITSIHNHDLILICEELLKPLMSEPTSEESRAFGKLLFNDDVIADSDYKLAGKWSDEDLKKNSFFRKMFIKSGIGEGDIPESGWPEGSITDSCTGLKRKMCLFSERASKTVTEIRKSIRA